MDVSNLFPEDPREAVPALAAYPALPESVPGGTTVAPPSYLRGRPDVAELGVVGQVAITDWAEEHLAPSIAWMQRVQALMLLWRRMSLGPLDGSTSQFLEDGVNWLQSDHVFTIASKSGRRLTLVAPNSGFDVRRFQVGTRLVQNPLWFEGNELGYIRWLSEPILGTFQLGDEIIPHPNSVLSNKSFPLVVRVDVPDTYEAGDNFTLVLDADVGQIDTARDSEETAPTFCAVRCFVLLPARWEPLLESRPLYAVQRQRVWSHAEIEELTNGVAELLDGNGVGGRIAYPSGTAVFKVERLEPGEDPVDITAGFVAAGRVACTHESGGLYKTRVWLGDDIQGTEAEALTTEGQSLRVTWWHESTEGTISPCQARCHWARVGSSGLTYCAAHDRGAFDFPTNTWVPDPPTGLAQFRPTGCYQWSGGGSAGHAGCQDFQQRVPSPPSVWGAFWRQVWGEIGMAQKQPVASVPVFRFKRHGVEGLFHVGGGRVNREIEMGVLREFVLVEGTVGYLNDALEFVRGLCWGSVTQHPALGPNYDDPDTWGPAGLLEERGVSLVIPNGLGEAWNDTNDPDGGQRQYPMIPAFKAESSSKGGRAAGAAQRLVTWRDVAVSLLQEQDGEERVTGPFTYVSEEDGTMRVRWTYGNPLGYFAAMVAGGVVAVAAISDSMLRIEVEPEWRTVTFFNTDTPPVATTGTIRAAGTVVRPPAPFELINDALHGDGNNKQRGVVPGDMLVFSGESVAAGVAGQGFEVLRAEPFAGTTFTAGWNNDPSGTAPSNILVPDEYVTGDAWGLARDVVWMRPRDIGSISGGVTSLVGASLTAGQQGVWAGSLPPTVKIKPQGGSTWTTVTPERINYHTGEITIAAADLTALAGAPFDVWVSGTVYDRRQGARAAHANMLRDVFEAMDTFRVNLVASSEPVDIIVNQYEALCAQEYGGPNNFNTGDDFGVYVSGGVGITYASDTAPRFVRGDISLENPNLALTAPGVRLTGTQFGFPAREVLSTVPDGAEIASAVIVYKFDEITEVVTVQTVTSNVQTGLVTTTTDGAGSMSVVLVARRADRDRLEILWAGPSLTVTEGEWAQFNITDAVKRYLATWRRSNYVDFSFIVAPGVAGFDPDGQTQAQMLAALLSYPAFSNWTPKYITCDANPNTPGSGGQLNPALNRSYTWRTVVTDYTGLATRGAYITLASLPDTVGDVPVADLRLDTNEERQWRAQGLHAGLEE